MDVKHKVKKLSVAMSIPVTILREGEYFVAYTPALDLSSYGKTMKKARSNFGAAVEIFLEEMLNRGTLEEELHSLGWEMDESNVMQPPVVVEHTVEKVQMPILVYA